MPGNGVGLRRRGGARRRCLRAAAQQGGTVEQLAAVSRLTHGPGLSRVELEVIDLERDSAVPRWCACGPRLDAHPDLNAAMAERAATRGVDVRLSGDGSDELLGVPRFATTAIAHRHGVRAARRYVADVARSGPGLFGEAVAALARCVPGRVRVAGYWAALARVDRPHRARAAGRPVPVGRDRMGPRVGGLSGSPNTRGTATRGLRQTRSTRRLLSPRDDPSSWGGARSVAVPHGRLRRG